MNASSDLLQSASPEKRKVVVNLYFPGILIKGTSKYDVSCKYWKCNACPLTKDTIWADLNKGSHNLVSHIQCKHGSQWKELYESHMAAGLRPYFDKVSDKAKTTYNLIEQIILTNQSLSLVENYYWRREHPEACSRVTLTNYIMRLSNMVFLKIKQEMPDKFGLLLDGWNGNDKTYYVGIYAHYVINGVLHHHFLQFVHQWQKLLIRQIVISKLSKVH
jgi:hypothetical protein